MNRRGQQLSINFLVKFILAVVLFGLGTMLMWRIFYASTDTLDVSQQEFDRRIFALNCKPSETVCVGSNKFDIQGGENVMVTVKVFNNHNEEHFYDLDFELRESDNSEYSGDAFNLLPERYVGESIPAKGSKEFSMLLKTTKRLDKGDYAIRILVTPDSDQMSSIPKRIYVSVK